jgi:hypothetical protein
VPSCSWASGTDLQPRYTQGAGEAWILRASFVQAMLSSGHRFDEWHEDPRL